MSDLKRLITGHANFIVGLICYLWVGIYPLFVVAMNPVPPQQEQLNHFSAIIVNAKNTSPNLTVELEDKTLMKMDFALDLRLFISGMERFYGLQQRQLAQLKGCNAEFTNETLKWVWPQRIRIWSLQCDAVNFSYQDALLIYEKSNNGPWMSAVVWSCHFFCLLLLLFAFFMEHKAMELKKS